MSEPSGRAERGTEPTLSESVGRMLYMFNRARNIVPVADSWAQVDTAYASDAAEIIEHIESAARSRGEVGT